MKKVHFMGVGGAGLSSVAIIAAKTGFEVSGCDFDDKKSDVLQRLGAEGVMVSTGHSAEHISDDLDMLCVSPAIFDLNNTHEELVATKAKMIPVVTWQEFMGQELQKGKRVIAVSGTKGKTTTTAFVGMFLDSCGEDPTVQVGAEVKKWGQNFRIGQSDWFVCEADEYANNFHHYQADIAVITNIEMDHPEFFASYDQYLESYVQFVRRMKNHSALILGIDSPGVRDLRSKIDFYHGKVVTYGVAKDADLKLGAERTVEFVDLDPVFSPAHGMSLRDLKHSLTLGERIPGEHNALNLTAVCALGAVAGMPIESFEQFVKNVELPSRRFELVGKYRGALLFDDYAHNPMSIRAALEAVRSSYPNARIWAVWQPHMYSRSIELFEDFANAFGLADLVVVLPIYASREQGSPLAEKISHRKLAEAISARSHKEAMVFESLRGATEYLRVKLTENDLVLNMGAGDNSCVVKDLVESAEVL